MTRNATAARWTLALGATLLTVSGSAYAAPQDDSSMGGPPAPPAMGGPPAPPATPASPAAPATPAAPSGEDVLVLKDGTEIRGRIRSEDESAYAVKVGGALRVVDKESVKEVRRGAPSAEPETDSAGAPGMDKGDAAEKERRKAKRRKDAQGADMATSNDAPLSADAEAWARVCIERVLAAGDDATRRSAAEAIRALGPAAFPLIRQAREGADEKGKALLDRIAESMNRGPGKKKGPDGAPPAVPPGQAKKGVDNFAPPGRGPRAVMERVRTELALDDATTRTVGVALISFGRELRETMADARDGFVTYEDARTKVGEMRGKLRDGLRGTLTEEQLAKLDVILDDMAPKKPGQGNAPPAKPKEPAPPEPPAK